MRVVWILVLFISSVLCDLPIHCVRSQTLGDWEFHLNKQQYPLNIRDKRVTCGNGYPNQVQNLKKVKNYRFAHDQETWQVSLKTNNEATAKTPEKKLEGWWTMMYDEGFGVNLPGYEFFNFFMYLKGTRSHSRSVCGRTMVGWYHDKTSDKIGCFYAIQKNGNNKKVTYAYSPLIEKIHKEAKRRSKRHYWLSEQQMTHKTLSEQEQSQFGLIEEQAETLYDQQQLQEAYKIASKWAKVNPKDIKEEDLPAKFDWTNVNGVDFVTPVRNQGACGSCYAVATTQAFEARRRIKHLDITLPKLAVQFLVKCGIFSQGCHGGFEYLAAFFIKLFGLPPLSEVEYDPNNDDTCADVLKKVKHLYKADDFHFVNDIYTKQDEIGMIRELVARGPITVGILPDLRFRHYRGGIIKKNKHFDSLVEEESDLDDVTHHNMKDYGKEWEEVEHAVLIIGYGETRSGVKYWKIRNSWGTRYGYRGDFYVERGKDVMHSESMSVAIKA